MSNEEREVVRAVFDLSGGHAALVPYDEVAIRLGTTITAVKTLSALLRTRNIAVITFGGIQLTPAGLEQARLQHSS